MTENSQKLLFSAVNNTNVLLYIDRKPKMVAINKIADTVNTKKVSEKVNAKTGIKTIEHLVLDNVFIHSLNSKNEIKLNKIARFYEFQNLNNIFEISPYSLKPFQISAINSLINEANDPQSIFYDDPETRFIKRNARLFGSKLESIENIELSNHLGYIIGIFLGRGYIELKDKNLKGNTVLVCTKDNFETVHSILDLKLKISVFHKSDDKSEYFTILDPEINKFFNTYLHHKNIPDWFYSSPYTFLNGFIHGLFQTNGTITFNKENTKAFATFKIYGHDLPQQFIDLLSNKYGFLTTFSLIPNKPFCKVSIKLSKELFGLLESGFEYKVIHNENKRELLAKSTGIFFQNLKEIPYRYHKSKTTNGYNFYIPYSKGFVIGNGLFISSIPNIIRSFNKNI